MQCMLKETSQNLHYHFVNCIVLIFSDTSKTSQFFTKLVPNNIFTAFAVSKPHVQSHPARFGPSKRSAKVTSFVLSHSRQSYLCKALAQRPNTKRLLDTTLYIPIKVSHVIYHDLSG